MERRTKEEFIQELTTLLITEGVSSLTIADIAARLNCSRRRIYEIAPTKEEVFIKICSDVFNKTLERGYRLARAETAPVNIIRAYMHGTLNTSGMTKACFIDLDSTAQGKAVFDAYQEQRVQGLEGIIDAGVKAGVFTSYNSRLVSEAILGAAHRLRNQQFLAETGMTIGDAFNSFYTLVLEGLLHRSEE
ncbi:TetR/AcrR family transcriptional regulator [Alcaligenaceae bacterium]|nr:TetR/AcrR family transcriptional regulator [Alcaligenaceae bacterium]